MSDLSGLKVGRVELPGVTMLVQRLEDGLILSSGGIESGETFLDGSLIARSWEMDLTAHQLAKDVVPLVWERRDEFDGFYRIRRVELGTKQHSANYPFSMELGYVGPETWSPGDVAFESGLTGTYLANTFAITTAAEPLHAPPPHMMYDAGANTPVYVERPLADRTAPLKVYRDFSYGMRPVWSCLPGDFYVGRCRIERTPALMPVRGDLVGRSYTGPVHGIRITNGMVRVTPSSLGNPVIEFWDGSAWRPALVDILVNGAAVAGWTRVSVLQNRPEVAAIRLYRGETGAGATRLDLTIRPGMRTVMGYLRRSSSAILGIRNGEASPAMTFTVERGRQDNASPGTVRPVFSTTQAYTSALNPGAMTKAAAVSFDFAVSMEIGAVPGAGNTAADLSAQHIGAGFGETVTPVRI